jgi:hypothetical protein
VTWCEPRGHTTYNEIENQPKKAEYQVWNLVLEITMHLRTKDIGKKNLDLEITLINANPSARREENQQWKQKLKFWEEPKQKQGK